MASIQRKYQVFVSGPRKGVQDEMNTIIQVINKSGNIPQAMELFHVDGKSSVTYIKEKIIECDIFIIMLTDDYGDFIELEGEDPRSYTHMEYEFAKRLGKPMLKLLQRESDRALEENIRAFREQVMERGSQDSSNIHFFDKGDKGRLYVSLMSGLKSTSTQLDSVGGQGWVPAMEYDQIATCRVVSKLADDSPVIDDMLDLIEESGNYIDRNWIDQSAKLYASKKFWHEMMSSLFVDTSNDIFFEAGTTVDTFARAFLSVARENAALRAAPNLARILVNGVFAKFLFDMRTYELPGVEGVSLFPPAPIEEGYAKTLGVFKGLPRRPACQFAHRELKPVEREKTDEFIRQVSKIKAQDLASFISFTGFTGEAWQPFVYGYRNIVMKRALVSASETLFICMSGEKARQISIDPVNDNCATIWDREEWTDLIETRRICFLFGNGENSDCGEISHWLAKEHGFVSTESASVDGKLGFEKCYNKTFADHFELGWEGLKG